MGKQPLDLGEIAYHAYGKTTNFLTYDGRQMPKWEDLPPAIRSAWQAAAVAAAAAAMTKIVIDGLTK